MRRFPLPSRSSIGAFSHSLISRSTSPSAMRRATDFISLLCGFVIEVLGARSETLRLALPMEWRLLLARTRHNVAHHRQRLFARRRCLRDGVNSRL